MGQTADDIRQELDRKRHELSHDVERIEEKVRSTFDINRYVEEQPLVATGVAVLAGFLLGNMIGGGSGNDKTRYRDYSSYSGNYSGDHGAYGSGSSYGGYTPQSGYYGGGSGGYQAPRHQSHQSHQGHGMMDTVKDSVKQGFQSSGGSRDIEATMSSVTAALTAMLMDKAREMLDQNLPGFSEKFEQTQKQQHGDQDRALSTTYSSGDSGSRVSGSASGDRDMDRSTGTSGSFSGASSSYGDSDASSFRSSTGSTASGSEHLGPSSSSSSRSM